MEHQHLLQSLPDGLEHEENDGLLSTSQNESIELDFLNDANDDIRDNSHLRSQTDDLTPDKFDTKYEASKYEFWAYCSWFIGNSGMALYQFAPVAFQNLLNQAAGAAGTLRFCGRDRNVNSIVLLSNGISFCVEVVVFLILGSFADFGTWRSSILIIHTLVAVAIGFAWLDVYSPDKWQFAVVLYIIGIAAFTVAFTFWTAAFVSLARNLPTMRQKAAELKSGFISRVEYDAADSMSRSKMYNIPNYVTAPCQVLILAVCTIILYQLDSNGSDAKSNWGIAVIIAFDSALALVFALPWFFLEKRRPGQSPPANMSIIRAGLWQWAQTASHIWRLKQSLIYLIGFFLMSDSFNTTITVVVTLQSEVLEYNMIKLNYLNMVGWGSQFFGVYGYWYLQRKYGLSSKTLWVACSSCIVLLDAWGMVGIWTTKIGFHHPWEFWLFQVWWGVFVGPYYSYCQIMISEVTPRGKEFLFFSFFNIVGTTTSFMGPIISSAIIDTSASKNNSLPFYFLTAVTTLSFFLVLFWLDLDKSRIEQADFLEEERLIKDRLARKAKAPRD